MKPYGSKRSFDTEPRIKSGRALVKRQGAREIAKEGDPNRPRCACGALATWQYDPGEGDYCDAHVPRGCSCQEDLVEPCCEYSETNAC